MALCLRHQSLLQGKKSSGMREGRFKDVVEGMTKKGKIRAGNQERLRVQWQTVSEEAPPSAISRQRAVEGTGKPYTSWQITFPRTESGVLRMRRHQGNGWCGADMLLWLAVLV